MPNLEKVLKGLEACAYDGCISCPYSDICSDSTDFIQLARDALELLTAQQPRVLTLEEVKVSNGKDLILEYGQWGCEDNIVTAVTIEGCGSKGVSFALSVVCDYATYNRKHSFGWRCWNVRPTDEQRKAVKWDE